MTEQEKREAYLRERGVVASIELPGMWSFPGGVCIPLDLAVCIKLSDDADIAIDAMLRLPALLERISAVRQLWKSSAWCDQEMRDAMAALFAEASHV